MKPPQKTRRSTSQVRESILEAAEHLFGQKGYAQTTTREIAIRAKVMEPLLFRQFGSKSGILEHLIADALIQFIEAFKTVMAEPKAYTFEDRIRIYVEMLHDLMTEHRESFLYLLTPDHGRTEGTSRLTEILDQFFLLMANYLQKTWRSLGLDYSDPVAESTLRVRMVFSLVASSVLLGRWLYIPDHPRPQRNEVVGWLTHYIQAKSFFGESSAITESSEADKRTKQSSQQRKSTKDHHTK